MVSSFDCNFNTSFDSSPLNGYASDGGGSVAPLRRLEERFFVPPIVLLQLLREILELHRVDRRVGVRYTDIVSLYAKVLSETLADVRLWKLID